MYRHLFFDLDGTVTRSRSLIEESMKQTLLDLMGKGYTVTIVSGAALKQEKKQMDGFACFYLAQNGNHAEHSNGKELWKHSLSTAERSDISKHINSIVRDWSVKDEGDLIQDRDCQISYSLIGHNEDLLTKERFDPDFSRRISLLKKYPLNSSLVEVKMGGTTCLDYFPKGKHKGYNVLAIIKELGWNKDESLYIGDALFPGGNDETVVGVIDTHAVKDPQDTLSFLRGLLSEAR